MQDIQPECFVKTLSSNVFQWIELHMVVATVREDIIQGFCTDTATTVTVLGRAHTEFNGGRKLDGEQTKYLPDPCKLFYMEPSWRQKFIMNVLLKSLA